MTGVEGGKMEGGRKDDINKREYGCRVGRGREREGKCQRLRERGGRMDKGEGRYEVRKKREKHAADIEERKGGRNGGKEDVEGEICMIVQSDGRGGERGRGRIERDKKKGREMKDGRDEGR